MGNKILEDFQNQFVGALLDNKAKNTFLDDIVPAGTLKTAKSALSAHQTGYYARLTEALGETFEGTWFALGDDLFFEVCKTFITSFPSKNYNLSNYGEQFPDFLAKSELTRDIPFLYDLAKFDWLFKEIFHAKQHQTVDTQALIDLQNSPHSHIYFGDTVRLFSSSYSVYNIWQLRKGESEKDVDIEKPQHLLLYKKNYDIYTKEISLFQHRLLTHLMQGESFSNVIEYATEQDSQEIVSLLSIIGSSGVIRKIEMIQT